MFERESCDASCLVCTGAIESKGSKAVPSKGKQPAAAHAPKAHTPAAATTPAAKGAKQGGMPGVLALPGSGKSAGEALWEHIYTDM